MHPERARELFRNIHEIIDKAGEAPAGEKRSDMKTESETTRRQKQKTIKMTDGLHLKDNPPLDHVRAWEADEEARQEARAKHPT